ncbi:hypothetical protein GCM10010401_22540 [Rarobacter faecitabidus]|uniref:Fibronectin type III domain protein n=1 Tax=Rarobacter faecitabidus TaxID=13243 RepID=A0A542ZW42_RARFA|nr:fibronectin type III domain-containing protein [Rarobacter faecitabidus]TQL64456.1 fibronectin type III domain protein [Rarobacter faecitabidus]
MTVRGRIAAFLAILLTALAGESAGVANAAGPDAPTGLSASASADGTVHFQWIAATGASAYRLEWSADPSFASGSVSTVNTYALDWISPYPLVTDAATELYWRVRSYSQAFTGEGLPSPTSAVSVDGTLAPSLIAPAGSGVTTIAYPAPTTFHWAPVTGAVGYELQYTSDVFDSGNPGLVTTTVKGTSFTPTAPLKRRDDASQQTLTWKWRVRAVLYNGTTAATPTRYGPYSTESQFQLVWNLPPTNLRPRDLTDVPGEVQSDLKFSWDAVPGAAKYRLTFGTGRNEADGSILEPKTVDVFTTTYIPTSTLPNVGRFWQVTPLDAAGNTGTSSPVLEFKKKWQKQVGPSASDPTDELVYPEALTGSTNPGTPPEMYLADFELTWEPLPRATFYLVTVYGPTGNVYCRTGATSATIIAYKFDGTGLSDNLKSHGDCLWVSDVTKQIQPRSDWTYSWQVQAIDYAGSLSTGYQSGSSSPGTFPADVLISNPSPMRYFTIKDEDRTAPSSTAVTLDQSAFTADNPPTKIGHPAPLMTWNLAGNGTGGFAPGYQVELFTDATRTNPIASFRTPSRKLRINGVFKDNQTANPYFAAVRPIDPTRTGYSWTSSAYWFLNDLSVDAFSWTKASTQLTGLAAITQEDGSALLSWNPQQVSGLQDGGSRGYQIRILNGGTQIGVTKKLEYPFYVAQKPATSTDTTFPSPMTDTQLPFGNNYSFEVAPLDANGNPGRTTAYGPFTVGISAPTTNPVTAISGGSATLSWNVVSAAVKYELHYRLVGSSTWTTVNNVGQVSSTLNELGQGAYEWEVRAIDSGTNASNWRTGTGFTIGTGTTTLTTADAAVLPSVDRVLRWTSTVGGAVRYQVQIADDAAFTQAIKSYETVATSFAIPDALTAGKQYQWRVRALAEPVGAGSALKVLNVSATRAFTVRTVPAKVAKPAVTLEGTGAKLTWTALTGANAGTDQPLIYIVAYREYTTDTDWADAAVQQTTPGEPSMLVTSLLPGKKYQFRVAAKNTEGIGPWSDVAEKETATKPIVAPTLTVTAKLGQLDLTIGRLSGASTGGSAITGYQLAYRRSADVTWTTINLPAITSRYTLDRLANATSYHVSVAAINGVGVGPAETVSVSTLGTASAPRNVAVKRGDRQVTVSWVAPAQPNGDITGYVIEVRQGSGAWKGAGSVKAEVTKTTVTGLANGKAHQIRVAARTKVGLGSYSAPMTVTPAGKPIAPAKITAKSSKKGKITVKWSKAGANGAKVTAYTVQFSNNGTKWKKVKKLAATKLKLVTTKGKRGKSVYFRVIATNALGNAVPSRAVSVVRK